MGLLRWRQSPPRRDAGEAWRPRTKPRMFDGATVRASTKPP